MLRLKSRHVLSVIMAVFCAAFLAKGARAVEVASGDNTLNVDGQLQLHGILESVDDPWGDSERLFLFLRQARLSINGQAQGVDYEVEWMMGGEEVPERNSVMSLLDAYANIPLVEDLFEVKIGQFKVPYSRERLFDSGNMLNTDRSIQNNYFNIGRDVGMAVHTKQGKFTGALGMFTGGGINIPERYIPEDLEFPMFVARVGVNSGLDEDVFTPYGVDDHDGEVRYAAYVNALYTGDSRVGHSTPLNVKYFDKSLVLESSWNPYIAQHDEKADFTQVGGDVAVKIPVCDESDLLLTAEVNASDFRNNAGDLQTSGGTVGAYLMNGNWIVGLRYAQVDPDSDMAYTVEDEETGEVTSYSITDDPIHEITPSFVYYMEQYHLKIIADVAVQLDVPVALEPGLGVYNLMRQPGQVSYASRGGIELQDNYLANLILQFNF